MLLPGQLTTAAWPGGTCARPATSASKRSSWRSYLAWRAGQAGEAGEAGEAGRTLAGDQAAGSGPTPLLGRPPAEDRLGAGPAGRLARTRTTSWSLCARPLTRRFLAGPVDHPPVAAGPLFHLPWLSGCGGPAQPASE